MTGESPTDAEVDGGPQGDPRDDIFAGTKDKSAQGKGAVAGVRWLVPAQMFSQVIRTVMNLVLVWFLSRGEFGLMAVASIVISLTDRMANFGTGQAVIQREGLDRRTTDAVFALNAAIGLALGAIIFIAATPLAIAFSNRDADTLLRVLAFSVLFKSLGIVHSGLLRRNLKFKLSATSLVLSTLTYLVVAVTLAAAGHGAISIAIGSTSASVLGTSLNWWWSGYRPSWRVDWSAVKPVMGFSMSLTGTNLFNFAAQNVDKITIGHLLSTELLGTYQLGVRTLRTPIVTLTGTMNQVLMPVLSRNQDDFGEQRRRFLQASAGTALLAFPVMTGLALLARPLIDVGLPDEWSDAATIVSLMALVGMLRTIVGLVSPVLIANGEFKVQLTTNMMLSTTLIASYLITAWHSLEAVVIGIGVVHILLMPVVVGRAIKVIDMKMSTYFRSLAPVAGMTAVMAAAVLTVRLVLEEQGQSSLVVVLSGAAVGAVLYFGMLVVFKPKGHQELATIVGLNRGNKGQPAD